MKITKKSNREELKKYIGRLAPSPSGRMHLGNVFSFLIAWADARKNSGELILRIDDLDDRCKNASFQETLIDDLKWLGLDWDNGPIYQSSRIEVYEEVWHAFQKHQHIYPCFCSRADLHAASAPHASDGTAIYSGKCRSLTSYEINELATKKRPAYRVEVPNERVGIHDRLQGNFFQNLAKECGDMILRRSDGVFSYQFTNAIDDALLGVNTIIRGNDLLTSAPREVWLISKLLKIMPDLNKSSQLFDLQNMSDFQIESKINNLNCKLNFNDKLTEAHSQYKSDLKSKVSLNSEIDFVHVPMLVNESGQRLAKRDKSLNLGEIKNTGAKPEDVVGTIAQLLGLTLNEKMTAQEFKDEFRIDLLLNKSQITVPSNIFFV